MDLEMLADFKPLLRPRQRQDISLTRNLRQVETDHPFIIFAGLFDRTLGGFIHHNLFCASVSLNYSNAKLHVCYTDDRPYLADIIEMNPHIHQCWTSDGLDNPFLGYFDGTSTRQSHDQQAMWEAGGASEPDFLLVPWMMDHRKLSGFFPRAHLRIPPEKRDALQARLTSLGVDTKTWFCTLHYREAGYLDRPADGARDLDQDHVSAIIQHVTRDLGGQIIRLGHPGMAALDRQDGVVDLSVDDNFMLQAYAVARARYHLQITDSGPMALAQGLGTPMALGNAVTQGGVFAEEGLVLCQHIVNAQGRRIPPELARRKGLLDKKIVERVLGPHGFRLQRNSLAELTALVDDIHAQTADCPGWRTTTPPEVETFPEAMVWPVPDIDKAHYVDYPELFSPT
ncbi:MAG: TIGR04372 family glycosyltransferase [Proteobacteria bacterium]|nr:TIGR04372 family glycosyltransferase [Pseudomonadota bacterium]